MPESGAGADGSPGAAGGLEDVAGTDCAFVSAGAGAFVAVASAGAGVISLAGDCAGALESAGVGFSCSWSGWEGSVGADWELEEAAGAAS